MKTEIIVGDTLDFVTSVPRFLASAGWTLTYKLIPKAAGPAVISFNASAQGDDYRVQVTAATTATWTVSDYSFEAYVTKAAERYTVDSGQVTIKANPASATTLDNRSHERKMLDQVQAAMFALNAGVKSYAIGSRQLTYRDMPELIMEESRLKWLVLNEEAREKIAAGLGNPRNVGIRFNRV
jgi:hypothetical protein